MINNFFYINQYYSTYVEKCLHDLEENSQDSTENSMPTEFDWCTELSKILQAQRTEIIENLYLLHSSGFKKSDKEVLSQGIPILSERLNQLKEVEEIPMEPHVMIQYQEELSEVKKEKARVVKLLHDCIQYLE